MVSEDDVAAIQAAFDQGGELTAAVEFRRLFPGVTDLGKAREWARAISGWKRTKPESDQTIDAKPQ